MKRSLVAGTLFTVLTLTGCAYKHKDADLVIHNAHIVTLDSADHEFQALAVKDGRVIELGPENQVLNEYTAKETYDAAGRTVYPGFIDGHCHFLGYGLNKQKIDLNGTKSWDEAIERTLAFAKAHADNAWVIGRGWDQNLWPQKQFPDNARLNELFPDRPVLLQRVDGHAAIVNQAALDKVGLNAQSVIAGGILELKDGKPTGLLVDNAVDLFQKIFDDADEATKRQALLDAQTDCFEKGLTMVCDAGLDAGTIELIKKMQEEGALKIRVYAMVSDKPANLEHFGRTGPIITDRLVVRSVKEYADGALGSRGALLKRPYADVGSAHFGLLLRTPEHFDSVATWCIDHGFQMATHCIGDSANRLVLEEIEPSVHGYVDRDSQIVGKVTVEKGAEIINSTIRGPAIIGENTRIVNAYVGPFTSVYHHCTIEGSEIEHSIVLEHSAIRDLPSRLEDSLIGRYVEVNRSPYKPRAYRLVLGDHSTVGVL